MSASVSTNPAPRASNPEELSALFADAAVHFAQGRLLLYRSLRLLPPVEQRAVRRMADAVRFVIKAVDRRRRMA